MATKRYRVRHVAAAGSPTTFCGKERKIGTPPRNRCLLFLILTRQSKPTKAPLERVLHMIKKQDYRVCPRCIDRINIELVLLSMEASP